MVPVATNYQHKKANPYLLPVNLYRRVIYTIKDYDRLKEEYNALLNESPAKQPVNTHGGNISSQPTEDKAIRLALISDDIHAIDAALTMIPLEYRQGIINSIKYRTPYPDTAHWHTWQKWRQRYVWSVARKLKKI